MSQEAPAMEPSTPAVPERAIRRSEDIGAPSVSNETRRYWRASEAPAPLRPAASGGVPGRPSEDGQHYIPPNQQMMHWQPPHDEYAAYDDQNPSPPRDYYLVPRGVNSAAPSPSPYPSSETYARRPYHNPRESTETHRPLVSSQQTPRRRPSASVRPRWADGYEDETPSPRSKRTPQKSRTGIYVVREGGGGGGDGTEPDEIMRLPFSSWMHGTVKNHFIAVLGEFVGTTMFLFFAFAGTLVANIGATESASQTTTNAAVGFSPIVNLYVAVAFGFSLMVNVWIFFRVSGGLFNPAVTLGMVMTRSINYTRGFLLVSAQLVGAIVASFIVQALFPSDFNVRTTLAPQTSIARGVIIEAILTAELVFTVFMLAKEKHRATYMAPVGIGLSLFVAELVGVFFTGGSLNPARSFGPCVATGTFDPEHWVYWVGPAIGAIAAFAFYRFIKILEYEMANPGQDAEDAETAHMEAKEARGEV
ncbi:uncharacterized protein LTR77_004477 [Saxophila tyrrhenica]|uniref:Aquaporin-like protein n=1 Tax=Saxophila tyrrhenica TaxID=1690608 RepID=A0AAV9PDZ4_9PEZI|nr:hypothetical protein LTR77_004477 [Saxophila tyrrhenica]